MKQNYRIRTLKVSEAASLIELWQKASLPSKPKGRDTIHNISEQIKVKHNQFFIAEFDNEIIGAVIASHNGRKGWINRLAVLPKFRNKGIASKLIEISEQYFLSNNIKIFACLIEDWNETSKNFFHNKSYRYQEDILYFTKRIDLEV